MAPTCDNKSCKVLKLWINERKITSCNRTFTKSHRRKANESPGTKFKNSHQYGWYLNSITKLSTSKICIILLILKTISVTVATIDINNNSFKNRSQVGFNLIKSDEKLFNLVSNQISQKDLNEQSQYFKIIKVISDISKTAQNLELYNVRLNNEKSDLDKKLFVQIPVISSEEAKVKNNEQDLRSQRSLANLKLIRKNYDNLELKNLEEFQNSTIFYGLHKRRRKKRYVKFPPEGGRYSHGRGQGRPFQTPIQGYHGGFLPWSGPRPGGLFHSNVPTMRPRSPRLVFRDPIEPGTLTAPASFFGNSLQDIGIDDEREERGAKGKYPSIGDQSLCTNGKCEFFLSCWMSSGLIEGSCGGFLYACCQHPDKEAPKTNEHHINDVITLPTNFGPVVNDFRCGVSIGKLGAQRRIVGGDEAGFGSFPWQAYIRIGSSRCGGSLVNRFHVVTAGHCVARASARQVQVTLGDYVINSAVEPLPAYTFGVREIRVHPYFKFTPQADRFDVAVLRLDRPVQYMPHIAPICLPEKNEDFLGQFGWAAGWGALQAGSRLRPKTLQAVDVPVIDNRLCEKWHKSNGINVVIYDEMMCAGYRNGGKDSCQGDSGGPLMMEKSNRWYLIGIVSAGYSCAQRGQPGIYHRVAHTVDWISYIINS